MDYLIYSVSLMVVYIGLAQMLHIQFGMLGIPNFGIVGFWGLGMYSVGVLKVQYGIPFLFALLLSCAVVTLVAYGLGRLILRLKGQDVICTTLAFSAIVTLLVITEKWLTYGVVGLGTIKYPLPFGKMTETIYLLILILIVYGFQKLINKLHGSHLGRLLFAIRDNEELASSLGKDTVGVKLSVFTATCCLVGVLGGLSAPLNQFLTPNMLVPGVTFAVWIALILGGKDNSMGAILGVVVTFGLFDILIETYLPVSPKYAVMVPNAKLFLYGALLIGILLYRPNGILRNQNSHKAELGQHKS